MGKTFVISNHKGGPGKTTISMQLLDIASNQEYGFGNKILAIDADPQGSLTDTLRRAGNRGLYDFVITNIDTRIHISDTLDFISCQDAASINEALKRNGEPFPETALSDLLDNIKDQYDAIIIDCPPEDDFLNNLAYMSADEVIVPITSDEYSLKGLIMLQKRINKIKRFNPMIQLGGIVINRVNIQTNAFKDTLASAEEMAKIYATKVYHSIISASIVIDDAQKCKEAVMQHDAKSKSAIQFHALVDEILHGYEDYAT